MKEYKKFDLEKAKSGAPVITRDGRKARIVCFDLRTRAEQPIAAAIEYEDYDSLERYSADGIFSTAKIESNLDLFMAPVKRTVWVNVYKDGDGGICIGDGFDTKGEAGSHNNKYAHYYGAYPIEIED